MSTKTKVNIISALIVAALIILAFSQTHRLIMAVTRLAADAGEEEAAGFIDPDDAFTPTVAPTPFVLTDQDYDDMSNIPPEADG